MRVVFDTSVIVAGTVAGHAHEARAAVWLAAARSGAFEARATTHAFAETWATLTAIPVDPPIPPASASRLVERFARHVTPIELTWTDYVAAFLRCSDRGLRSGALYDAIHQIAAERCDAALLLTFNTRHFERLAGPERPRILAPPDPPGLAGLV